MNINITTIRAVLANAISGKPMPSVTSLKARQMLQTVCDYVNTSNTHDTALLGTYALQLVVDRLMNEARAERESALLVDKLRGL